MSSLTVPTGIQASAAAVEVRPLRPGEEEEWDRFVTAAPAATFFHLHGWGAVVEKVLGHRPLYLTARRAGKISGVLPVSRVRSLIFGDSMVSMPLAVYGGPAASDEASYRALVDAAAAEATQSKAGYLELRNREEPYQVDLPGRDLYVTFTQDLSAGPEALFAQLPRDTRYAVRKSLKTDLEWCEDISLAEFYEIYAHSVHRLGTPVFPRSLFEQLRRQFPGRCHIAGVRKQGLAIAAVFSFYFRDQVLPYYGGALAEYNRDAPNNFMYWKLIEQSCRAGFRRFDFGRSKKGTGSYAFKASWSMQVSELPYRYHLVRAREVPHMSPVDGKFRLATELWKKMPFRLSKLLGPPVIRRVPSV